MITYMHPVIRNPAARHLHRHVACVLFFQDVWEQDVPVHVHSR